MKTKSKTVASPKRWFTHPALSLLLFAAWLLLQQSLAPAHLLVGGLFAVLLPRYLLGLLGPAMRPRKPGLMLRFALMVLSDIVRSNLTVARLVLAPAARPSPAWVRVPLALRQPGPIALLATVITSTPGTVSCVVDEQAHEIWVHALDCGDAPALAAQIKQRYERPLLEIFE